MREEVIIADSSPLIALARINQLELLPQFATRVIIPPTVWHEITIGGKGLVGAKEVSQITWLEIQAAKPELVTSLKILIDPGEAEAIALAQTLSDPMLLLDDARARRVAERLNIRRIGTVGLLRWAKKVGLINEIRPYMETLQKNGIYIRPALIEAVLKDVGE